MVLLKSIQISVVVQELRQFCWMGGFCLLVELHRWWVCNQWATPSSFENQVRETPLKWGRGSNILIIWGFSKSIPLYLILYLKLIKKFQYLKIYLKTAKSFHGHCLGCLRVHASVLQSRLWMWKHCEKETFDWCCFLARGFNDAHIWSPFHYIKKLNRATHRHTHGHNNF